MSGVEQSISPYQAQNSQEYPRRVIGTDHHGQRLLFEFSRGTSN